MQAWVLDKPALVTERPLNIRDIPVPYPAEDELLLSINACGICRTDLHVVEGELAVRRSPLVPGHQIVGRVAGVGSRVNGFATGDRVGVAWLNRTCGVCEYCRSHRENLCERAQFTGWTVDGGYAEYAVAPAAYTYPLPEGFDDIQAAPLLCAGIIGYRCLRQTGLGEGDWAGARLGLYGFGAAGHVCIQLARARGAEVYVCTRDRERHQSLARELGATWVGDATAEPPEKLDAAIIFAPAGELVPIALKATLKGGTVVLGGIHMSPIPSFDYSVIYGERVVRSVANNTRDDGREFLLEAASVPVRTHTQIFSFDQANDALIALKNDSIRGAGVVVME
ncbi:MAG TPA: zinc-dependent alcohol dehydrogenase family protein [Pyrinomonadaceae bacterium]|jgi:propanol-preferring alcohol dehydrogenase|nr:zinc-dependent alcohol dehydrogenase family protein [Pyrinomonadaceae bacterium]